MRQKIVLSLVLLFAIFVTGAIIASVYVTTATEQLKNLVEMHEIEGLRRILVINLQTVQADLYTAHTPMERKLDGIVANVADLDAAASSCTSCHHRPDLARRLNEVYELIDEYENALSYYITASANRERIERLGIEAAEIGNQILERTEKMSETASMRLDSITERAISRFNRVGLILLATVILGTGLGIGVASYLVRSVTGPIGRLVRATRIIASGDLGHQIEDVEEAEFGELATHFNAMTTALEESYERLKSANENLQREINEREEAEKQSKELQAQLFHAQKMESLGTLSAGIAHEFGNSLQIIQSCAERLDAITDADAPGRHELQLIENAAQRGAELTRRLLTFGCEVQTRLRPIDINEQVRRAKGILDRTLPASIEIQTVLADDIAPVDADTAEIEHVLVNLALNARDAMPDGGLLRIETSRGDGEGPALPGSEAREWVVLRVSDTGQGMDDATVRQIFDPFFTTKEVGAGTGLGLAVVYGIVKGYGGQIRCESEQGGGTSFEIRLPGSAVRPEAAEAERATTKTLRRGNELVLLVDDEALMVKVIKANLEELGYRVHTADSGEEALEFFAERGHEVELVFLDVGMPGMGGRACLKKLLEIDPSVKVIMSTGYAAQSDREEMKKAGARGFLAKPYRLSDILGEIEAVLSA